MRTTIAAYAVSLIVSSSAFGQELELRGHQCPCEVLAMLEAAHDALETSNAPKLRE